MSAPGRIWNTLELLYSRVFCAIPGADVPVSCLPYASCWCHRAHWAMGQPSEHGTPWNGIIPGCPMLYQGPTFQCPVCHLPAAGVTWHTGLWANRQNIPGCPVLYQGLTFQFPDATCRPLVSHGTLGYGPSVRTRDTLEWDNSRVFHPILGAHIQVSRV